MDQARFFDSNGRTASQPSYRRSFGARPRAVFKWQRCGEDGMGGAGYMGLVIKVLGAMMCIGTPSPRSTYPVPRSLPSHRSPILARLTPKVQGCHMAVLVLKSIGKCSRSLISNIIPCGSIPHSHTVTHSHVVGDGPSTFLRFKRTDGITA